MSSIWVKALLGALEDYEGKTWYEKLLMQLLKKSIEKHIKEEY